jgi:NifB/MoaA-like Fe-S oxidoreductase
MAIDCRQIDFPFTKDDGSVILNSEWLAREIREKCGDEIGWRMEKILLPDPKEEKQYKSMADELQQIRSDLSDLDEAMECLLERLREKAGERI